MWQWQKNKLEKKWSQLLEMGASDYDLVEIMEKVPYLRDRAALELLQRDISAQIRLEVAKYSRTYREETIDKLLLMELDCDAWDTLFVYCDNNQQREKIAKKILQSTKFSAFSKHYGLKRIVYRATLPLSLRMQAMQQLSKCDAMDKSICVYALQRAEFLPAQKKLLAWYMSQYLVPDKLATLAKMTTIPDNARSKAAKRLLDWPDVAFVNRQDLWYVFDNFPSLRKLAAKKIFDKLGSDISNEDLKKLKTCSDPEVLKKITGRERRALIETMI